MTVSDVDLAKHLFIEHKKSDGSFADFTCTDCEISFDSVGRLALHCSLMHQHPPTGVVKHVERLDLNDTDFSSTESIVGSTVDSDEEDVEDKRGCEEAEKVTNNHSFSNLKDIDQGAEIDLGFSGRKLYRCGNKVIAIIIHVKRFTNPKAKFSVISRVACTVQRQPLRFVTTQLLAYSQLTLFLSIAFTAKSPSSTYLHCWTI